MAAPVTSEFVALWTRRAVDTTVERGLADTVGRGLVGIVGTAVDTAVSQIPYRLSIGCRVGGHTCAPFCALGSGAMGADDESEASLDGVDDDGGDPLTSPECDKERNATAITASRCRVSLLCMF